MYTDNLQPLPRAPSSLMMLQTMPIHSYAPGHVQIALVEQRLWHTPPVVGADGPTQMFSEGRARQHVHALATLLPHRQVQLKIQQL